MSGLSSLFLPAAVQTLRRTLGLRRSSQLRPERCLAHGELLHVEHLSSTCRGSSKPQEEVSMIGGAGVAGLTMVAAAPVVWHVDIHRLQQRQ